MKRVITLTPMQTSITGAFSPGDLVIVLCDAALAPFTFTLPDAVSCRDVDLILRKVDSSANAITVVPFGTQTINVVAGNVSSISLDDLGAIAQLTSDYSNWTGTVDT